MLYYKGNQTYWNIVKKYFKKYNIIVKYIFYLYIKKQNLVIGLIAAT